jgi:PIN domain nuclease of toxin-antitoxin system
LKKLLLDTHLLLWWLREDKRLDEKTKALINDPANLIYVSSASIWEAAIKRASGKLEFTTEKLFHVLKSQGIIEVPVTIQHALIAGKLPPYHQDPFDRMLVAQALQEGLTLVTHDNQLKYYEVPIIWV